MWGLWGVLEAPDPRVVSPVRRGTPDLYPFWGLVAVRCKLGAGIDEKVPLQAPVIRRPGWEAVIKCCFNKCLALFLNWNMTTKKM